MYDCIWQTCSDFPLYVVSKPIPTEIITYSCWRKQTLCSTCISEYQRISSGCWGNYLIIYACEVQCTTTKFASKARSTRSRNCSAVFNNDLRNSGVPDSMPFLQLCTAEKKCTCAQFN